MGDTRIEVERDGKVVGVAVMERYTDLKNPGPIEFFVRSINVDPRYRNRRVGSELIEGVNFVIDSLGASGRLVDGIDTRKKAAGMHQKHGWRRIKGTPVDNLFYGACCNE